MKHDFKEESKSVGGTRLVRCSRCKTLFSPEKENQDCPGEKLTRHEKFWYR